jgi:hypothetical protein
VKRLRSCAPDAQLQSSCEALCKRAVVMVRLHKYSASYHNSETMCAPQLSADNGTLYRVKTGSIRREPESLSLGVMRSRREAHHSPTSSSSAEVKRAWRYTPSWRGARLKHRENFTFTFYLVPYDEYNKSIMKETKITYVTLVFALT